MKLRTDDDIYRARLLYLGPPGYTLPFHLPYAQYGVFALLLATLMLLRWLITGTVDLFPSIEIALSLVATSVIFKFVDSDRPARAVIRTALTDWRRSRDAAETTPLPSFTARKVRLRPLVVEPSVAAEHLEAHRQRQRRRRHPLQASPMANRAHVRTQRDLRGRNIVSQPNGSAR